MEDGAGDVVGDGVDDGCSVGFAADGEICDSGEGETFATAAIEFGDWLGGLGGTARPAAMSMATTTTDQPAAAIAPFGERKTGSRVLN